MNEMPIILEKLEKYLDKRAFSNYEHCFDICRATLSDTYSDNEVHEICSNALVDLIKSDKVIIAGVSKKAAVLFGRKKI